MRPLRQDCMWDASAARSLSGLAPKSLWTVGEPPSRIFPGLESSHPTTNLFGPAKLVSIYTMWFSLKNLQKWLVTETEGIGKHDGYLWVRFFIKIKILYSFFVSSKLSAENTYYFSSFSRKIRFQLGLQFRLQSASGTKRWWPIYLKKNFLKSAPHSLFLHSLSSNFSPEPLVGILV